MKKFWLVSRDVSFTVTLWLIGVILWKSFDGWVILMCSMVKPQIDGLSSQNFSVTKANYGWWCSGAGAGAAEKFLAIANETFLHKKQEAHIDWIAGSMQVQMQLQSQYSRKRD